MPLKQVNLLRQEPRYPPSLVWGSMVVLLWAAGLSGYGLWLQQQNRNTEVLLLAEQAQVDQLRAALAARRQKPGDEDRDRLGVEALRAQVQPHLPMLTALEKGELGSEESPVFVFRQLSALAREQVWLSTVSLSQRQLSLSGQATGQAVVVGYQRQLNEVLTDRQLRLDTLESIREAEPEAPTEAGDDGAAPPSLPTTPERVRFALNSR